MIKNFLKTAFRSLLKNKGYSFLNIAGLAVGIACAALIFLWVEDEVHYDNNNVKKDRLYLVKTNETVDAGIFTHSSTPRPLAPAMKADLTSIANTCRVTEGSTSLLFGIGDKLMYASGNYAEPSLFDMLTLPFVQGNAQTAFSELNSLVITEKTAKKFFGDDKNVVGKRVKIDNKEEYVITGVVKDLPDNSSIQFEWLAPFEIDRLRNIDYDKWGNSNVTTYAELKPGIRPEDVNKQLYNYIEKKSGIAGAGSHVFLFGMNDWRLYNQFDNGKKTGGGRIQYVRLFSTIAWIILLIACINFMNLATARSEKRAREVGVRKVLGAGRKWLVVQFIGEALFMALLATISAVILICLTLPLFNALVQKNLSPGFTDPVHLTALLLLTLICGLVAGSYPSLYLSSFNPVFVLKGIKLKAGSATFIRKGLVVLQFGISIVLITATIIIYRQIQHIKSRNLGFNKDNLVQMRIQGDMAKNFAAIKQDLINTGMIENVALADHETITGGNNTTDITWDGKNPNSVVVISQRLVSPEFFSTMDMHFTEGNDFRSTDIIEMGDNRRPKDTTARDFNIVITESMEKLMGEGSAIGKSLHHDTDFGMLNLKVNGVVKDYVYGNMYGKADPVMFYCVPQAAQLLYVRTKANNDPEKVLAKMEAVMKKDNPAYPFEYKFVDEQFNNMFLNETLISKLSRVFAALAIFISCLGLFGLAAYTAERRIKEIGVRKVLGATVFNLSALLSKDFIRLVIMAIVVATPVAWWIMNNWLRSFAYRITVSWWMFAVAGLLAIVIALLTVSFQAIKAALANPVKSLRTE